MNYKMNYLEYKWNMSIIQFFYTVDKKNRLIFKVQIPKSVWQYYRVGKAQLAIEISPAWHVNILKNGLF